MKRTIVTLGVAAAMAVAPAVASAGNSAEPARAKQAAFESMRSSPQRATGLPAAEVVLYSTRDSRSGGTLFRLGNSGLWME